MSTATVTVPVPYTGARGTVLCPPCPGTRGTVGHGQPTVLVCNLCPAPLPPHPRALKLAEQARAAGWHVRVGYAKAEVPAHHHLNGNLAKAAHVLETIGVQYRRHGRRGRAMWHREAGGGWKFESAFIGIEAFGWSTSGKTKLRSILEGIME